MLLFTKEWEVMNVRLLNCVTGIWNIIKMNLYFRETQAYFLKGYKILKCSTSQLKEKGNKTEKAYITWVFCIK